MIFHLSNREIEVINCLAKGWLYKEIAADLGISFSAVHKHQYRIYRKLRVGNRTEAILNSVHWGIIARDVSSGAGRES